MTVANPYAVRVCAGCGHKVAVPVKTADLFAAPCSKCTCAAWELPPIQFTLADRRFLRSLRIAWASDAEASN